MKYINLTDKAINPNRAKLWAVGLSIVAALIAMMTIKSNYDYFAQYFDGFAFWMRVVPFFAVETTIISLPLAIGWGNRAQIIAAGVFEIALIVLSILHTSFVGQSIQAKQIAESTRTAASADLERISGLSSAIAARNAQAQALYTSQMKEWRRVADLAKRNDQQPPPPPTAPTLEAVPAISNELSTNATLSVEEAAEKQISHAVLLRLLYAMILCVIGAAILMAKLADSVRVRNWLLKQRENEISQAIAATEDHSEVVLQLPFPAPSAVPQNRIGFNPPVSSVSDGKDTDTKTPKDCIGVQQSVCLSNLRHKLRQVSEKNFGVSFKVDQRGGYIFVRAMGAEQGSQVTLASLKFTPEQAQRVISQPDPVAQQQIVALFAQQNVALNA